MTTMFNKLDGYINIVDDTSQPLSKRLKNFKFANNRLKKINKEIMNIKSSVSKYQPIINNDVNITDWDDELKMLTMEIDSFDDVKDEDIVNQYKKISDDIVTMISHLNKSKLDINKIIENNDNIESIRIDQLFKPKEISHVKEHIGDNDLDA